jgi:hypothetical protein
MTTLTLSDTPVRQDTDGRFCLNDLHKASGGLAKHRPGEWLRLDQTKSLIAELGDAGIPASLKGNRSDKTAQGTYVVKELVYAYAMWISPAFHIRVIRAYDAAQATPPQTTPLLSDPDAGLKSRINKHANRCVQTAYNHYRASLLHALREGTLRAEDIEQWHPPLTQATQPAQPALPPPQSVPARVRLLVTLEPDGNHRSEVVSSDANIYTVGNLHELLTKRGLILADPNDAESVSAFCYAIPERNLLDAALIVNNRMISLAGRLSKLENHP